MIVSDMFELMRPVLRFARVMINYTLSSSYVIFPPPPPDRPPPSCYLDDHRCFVPAGQGKTDEKDLSHSVIS